MTHLQQTILALTGLDDDVQCQSVGMSRSKHVICKNHYARICGLHDSKGVLHKCSFGGKKCSFAHHDDKVVPTAINKSFCRKVTTAKNGGKNLSKVNLINGGNSEKLVDELQRRSRICPKHARFLQLLDEGTATIDDICIGSHNCYRGVHDVSLLLCSSDWKTGKSETDSPGIKLTEFGLVPLAVQKSNYEKKMMEKSLVDLLADSNYGCEDGKTHKAEWSALFLSVRNSTPQQSSLKPLSTVSKPEPIIRHGKMTLVDMSKM